MSRSGLLAETESVSTGAASGSNFSTAGCSMVRGRSGSTRLTRSRTSWEAGGDDDRREIDLGKAVETELEERERADHGQRQDDHCREDRPTHGDGCEPLHV